MEQRSGGCNGGLNECVPTFDFNEIRLMRSHTMCIEAFTHLDGADPSGICDPCLLFRALHKLPL